jgi:hypothetical protein
MDEQDEKRHEKRKGPNNHCSALSRLKNLKYEKT